MGLSLGKWVTEGVPLSRKWETCLLRVIKHSSELSSVCLSCSTFPGCCEVSNLGLPFALHCEILSHQYPRAMAKPRQSEARDSDSLNNLSLLSRPPQAFDHSSGKQHV